MIQHTPTPTLRGIYLVANHPSYALTLEEHEFNGRQLVVRLHGASSALTAHDVAALSVELFALRRSFTEPLFMIEDSPDDERWAGFLSYYGFKPLRYLPCTDGQDRRIFVSPAVSGAAR